MNPRRTAVWLNGSRVILRWFQLGWAHDDDNDGIESPTFTYLEMFFFDEPSADRCVVERIQSHLAVVPLWGCPHHRYALLCQA
ncbi:expressed unknown protein [Seminavis robusta]|uniref:Uncharacterized protein n=1 Tax=Seminavis robusta TaxID=568900 RepID=A0A9N8HIN5_9STRA|nr:expressed unknown protein [Seminavis robusta]|eukprot:Sro606_g174480.1 n/a (83) ;mRNA; f:22902-23242